MGEIPRHDDAHGRMVTLDKGTQLRRHPRAVHRRVLDLDGNDRFTFNDEVHLTPALRSSEFQRLKQREPGCQCFEDSVFDEGTGVGSSGKGLKMPRRLIPQAGVVEVELGHLDDLLPLVREKRRHSGDPPPQRR